MIKITENIFCFQDTCNVYLVRNGREAILIDFGSGDILDQLHEAGVDRVTDVLMTHHHRDQGQGLHRAAAAGIAIRVPHQEQDLFASVNEHWQAREILNNYNVRQDRFSLLQSVPIAGTLKDYGRYRFAGVELEIIPAPGHTVGSIAIRLNLDGLQIVFSGDLIYGPGKVWSMSATQTTYNGADGVTASVMTLLKLRDLAPDLLLPSHGDPIDRTDSAIDLLIERFRQLLTLRKGDTSFIERRLSPYEEITPHLLRNTTSVSNSYVLLSDSGKALVIDYGFDFSIGTFNGGFDRSGRRPWLYNIEILKTKYGVSKIDVALPTHYHDDHVAGFNLLREVEGAQVWAAANFADLLEHPTRYDVPCLWFDPIPVDKVLPLETEFAWEEYTFTLYELGGHTLYAVAIQFEADGLKMLATGDQQYEADVWNYVYKNRFRSRDYIDSAALYNRLKPDLFLTGHWGAQRAGEDVRGLFAENGATLERLHRELLPEGPIDLGAEGFCARIYPYQQAAFPGEIVTLDVEVDNPSFTECEVQLRLVFPDSWALPPMSRHERMQARETRIVSFPVPVPADCLPARRARIGLDLTVGTVRLGQHAEALVTIESRGADLMA